MFIMYLFGLLLFELLLSCGARRTIRIGGSHYDAQQHGSTLANRLDVSAGALEALIPGPTLTRLSRRADLQAGALHKGFKRHGWRAAHLAAPRAAPWFRSGPRRAKVHLQEAKTLPKVDQIAALTGTVVVKIDTEPVVTEGGIVLPTVYMEDPGGMEEEVFVKKGPRLARVLSVGPDAVNALGLPILVGQDVVVGPASGTCVQHAGLAEQESVESDIFVFNCEDIWGIV